MVDEDDLRLDCDEAKLADESREEKNDRHHHCPLTRGTGTAPLLYASNTRVDDRANVQSIQNSHK